MESMRFWLAVVNSTSPAPESVAASRRKRAKPPKVALGSASASTTLLAFITLPAKIAVSFSSTFSVSGPRSTPLNVALRWLSISTLPLPVIRPPWIVPLLNESSPPASICIVPAASWATVTASMNNRPPEVACMTPALVLAEPASRTMPLLAAEVLSASTVPSLRSSTVTSAFEPLPTVRRVRSGPIVNAPPPWVPSLLRFPVAKSIEPVPSSVIGAVWVATTANPPNALLTSPSARIRRPSRVPSAAKSRRLPDPTVALPPLASMCSDWTLKAPFTTVAKLPTTAASAAPGT